MTQHYQFINRPLWIWIFFFSSAIRAKKRKLSTDECRLSSPESSPIAPAAKRVRRLSFDDNLETSLQSTSSSPVKTEAQIMMDKVNTLQSEFPLLPRQVCFVIWYFPEYMHWHTKRDNFIHVRYDQIDYMGVLLKKDEI